MADKPYLPLFDTEGPSCPPAKQPKKGITPKPARRAPLPQAPQVTVAIGEIDVWPALRAMYEKCRRPILDPQIEITDYALALAMMRDPVVLNLQASKHYVVSGFATYQLIMAAGFPLNEEITCPLIRGDPAVAHKDLRVIGACLNGMSTHDRNLGVPGMGKCRTTWQRLLGPTILSRKNASALALQAKLTGMDPATLRSDLRK